MKQNKLMLRESNKFDIILNVNIQVLPSKVDVVIIILLLAKEKEYIKILNLCLEYLSVAF